MAMLSLHHGCAQSVFDTCKTITSETTRLNVKKKKKSGKEIEYFSFLPIKSHQRFHKNSKGGISCLWVGFFFPSQECYFCIAKHKNQMPNLKVIAS